MTSACVVAIPSETDYVWNLSSEKIPHMTLLFLGELDSTISTQAMTEFLEHVINTSMRKFGLDVERRDVLGPDEADVLIFGKYFTSKLKAFRNDLLKQDDFFKAYEKAEQYPEWTPHLTLGYPKTPAKKDTREYPGVSWVNFDKIALWLDDFDGPTFNLPSDDSLALEMSEIRHSREAALGRYYSLSLFENELKHHGVKGMKWGVLREKASSGDRKSNRILSKADSKWEKEINTYAGYVKINNHLADKLNGPNGALAKFNSKYSDKIDYTRDSPASRKYYSDFEKFHNKMWSESVKELYGESPSGKKHATVKIDPMTREPYILIKNDELAHFDLYTARLKLLTSSNGFIIGIDLKNI